MPLHPLRLRGDSDRRRHHIGQLRRRLLSPSVSRIPACAFTISANAQNVTASP